MTFKDFYEIPKFKKLDNIGKIIFVFSFLLPLGIVYTFLHLYFLPFGLDKDYTLGNKEVSFTDKSFFYEIDGQEVLDGVAEIKVEPRIAKRNVRTNVSIEGENLYLIPDIFKESDIDFTPEFTREFEDDFDYKLILDYRTKNEDFIVLKIDYEIDLEQQKNNELLLKFENLRIIQNENFLELRVQRKDEGDIKIYTTRLDLENMDEILNENVDTIKEEEVERKPYPVTIYAIYKKPTNTNGFIEIFAENRLSNRTIIPSQEKGYYDNIDIQNIETIWNTELEKDISQRYISLKQEQYTYELLQRIPSEFRDVVNINLFYEKLFKPEGFEEEEITIELNGNKDEVEVEHIEEGEEYEEVTLMGDGFFRYDENDYNRRFHVFYNKEFYNDFSGNILQLSVGYEYPIVLKKEFGTLRNTPMFFKIVGENAKIENFKINLFRDVVWKKL